MTAMAENLFTTMEELAARRGWLDERAYVVRSAAHAFEIHTFTDVFTGARAAAAVLVAHGVRPGDRVLLAVPDGIGFVRAFLAILSVHPAEVEELLIKQPDVSDVAVCAIADAQGVSRLVAYVVPTPAGSDDSLKGRLIAGLRGKAAPQKVPRTVGFVPELPRTPTGKLRRRALREAGATFETTGSWQVGE
jgi:acyl-coenzyme A synthetase/AMP-(fatty) acid ligase